MRELKIYFNETFVLEKRINHLTEQLGYLRHRLTSPTGGGIGNELGIKKTRNVSAGEDLLVKILSMEDEVAQLKLELLELEQEIRALTLHLTPVKRAILTWRYICRLQWKVLARRAEMSEMHIMREHNHALEEIAKYADFQKIASYSSFTLRNPSTSPKTA
ncbi:MAG: hypothetical protein FWB74_09805 [Defluviitaleaceae bacterium]|nr:hypothetical protein [Defluviitaleaceae bacterium]